MPDATPDFGEDGIYSHLIGKGCINAGERVGVHKRGIYEDMQEILEIQVMLRGDVRIERKEVCSCRTNVKARRVRVVPLRNSTSSSSSSSVNYVVAPQLEQKPLQAEEARVRYQILRKNRFSTCQNSDQIQPGTRSRYREHE